MSQTDHGASPGRRARTGRRAAPTGPARPGRRDKPAGPAGARARRQLAAVTLIGMLLVAAIGCSGTPPVHTVSRKSAPPPQNPQNQLLARVAAAKDKKYRASYTLKAPGAPDRSVQAQLAKDGSWRVDVSGGAHAGTRDVAVVGNRHGVYQCALEGSVSCTRVAKAGGHVPAAYDPMVQHPFTDWLDVLSDPQAALSVTADSSLSAPRGKCFSVEPTSVALPPAMNGGIYCFDSAGVLTAAQFGVGTLVITSAAQTPPRSVTLPGPALEGRAAPTSAPPSQPTATASGPGD